MPYSEERKKYAREWYRKNKARLLADPKRKESKKRSDKADYEKHKEKRKQYQKNYVKFNRSKVKERRQLYYQRTRDVHIEKGRIKRQTAEYKSYMKAYREKNKEKINRQERITGARYIRRQIEGLTDAYIVSQILMSKKNTLSLAELKNRSDLIEKKRQQIMAWRKKYGSVKMEEDILAQIEAAQKQRNQKPYEFVREWRN